MNFIAETDYIECHLIVRFGYRWIVKLFPQNVAKPFQGEDLGRSPKQPDSYPSTKTVLSRYSIRFLQTIDAARNNTLPRASLPSYAGRMGCRIGEGRESRGAPFTDMPEHCPCSPILRHQLVPRSALQTSKLPNDTSIAQWPSLAWSNPRHIMMLAQVGKIFIQLFHPLFVRLDAFAFESLIKLSRATVSTKRWC